MSIFPTPFPTSAPTPLPTFGPTTLPPVLPQEEPTPAPTFPPTFPPTFGPTTLPPVEAQDEECELSMTVQCAVVEGGVRIPCNQVPRPTDASSCLKPVEYTYQVTNTCDPTLNTNCDTAVFDRFDAIRNGEPQDLFSILPPGASLTPTETGFYVESGNEVDFCVDQTVETNAIITANTAPGPLVGVCAAEATDIFTITFEEDEPCDVTVDIACFVNGDRRNINCQEFPRPQTEEDCVQEVIYSYVVTNVGDNDQTIIELDRTRNGITVDLRALLDETDLSPGRFAIARETDVLDYCVEKIVSTTADVISDAAGIGNLRCSDQNILSFPISMSCNVAVETSCFANEALGFTVPCDEFNPLQDTVSGGCEHVLKYVHTVTNTGPVDDVIQSVVATRDGESSELLDQEFNLRPGEFRDVEEFILVDYCQGLPADIFTEVEVTADMLFDGGSCFDADEYLLRLPESQCSLELSMSCSTFDGNECVIHPGKELCKHHPSFLEFKFVGRPCSHGGYTMSDKFKCDDYGVMESISVVHITVTSGKGDEYFVGPVAYGERIRIGRGHGKLHEVLVVNIFDRAHGKLLQRINFDASCSNPLHTLDVLGGFILLGFGDEKHHVSIPDNQFQLSYEIKNIGFTPALLEEFSVSIEDSEILATPFSLLELVAGETITGTETIDLSMASGPVTLNGEVFAENLSGVSCDATDSLEIGVGEQPPAECRCIDCPYAYKFKFTGATCDDSENSQEFWCSDEKDISDWARIIVTDHKGKHVFFEGDVEVGQFFDIELKHKFPEDTTFKIMVDDSSKWHVAQIVKFNTSCEKPLFLEDTFGAIEVYGWKNHKQGTVVVGGANTHC
mmetsp:Transcript_1667/g.3054  ORF Transcript_1667/g.3054 Transcript_1667/m.3054 type:complete len:847 (-) Transcript_1667:240-2780(-)